MGVCQASENMEKHHEQQISSSSTIDASQLAKAKKVIDGLNVEISCLEKEISLLKQEMTKEKQIKNEEADKLRRAERKIEQLEAEKAELSERLVKVAEINRVSVDDEEEHNHAHGGSGHAHESCFGECQSPINIISMESARNENITVPLKDEQFAENGLKFNYPEKVRDCTIINNGHTVQVNIPSAAKCRLNIYDKEFELKQFHFHTPSEHTIDSKQYEMEMHLVHMNEKNEICVLGFIFSLGQRHQKPRLELTKSRAHLVLSRGGKGTKGGDDEESDAETDDEFDDDAVEDGKAGNDFLAQFWDQLPTSKTQREIPLRNAISFDYLFDTASKNMRRNVKSNEVEIDMDIYEYMGSLTTPPYTEGVQWLLSKTTHFINRNQLNLLRVCWNFENNARDVQQYFGRQVSLRTKSSMTVV